MKKVNNLIIIISILITVSKNLQAQCFTCSNINISVPASIKINQPVTFSATYNNCSPSSPSSGLLMWDFGDGSAPSASSSHVYLDPGVYEVKHYINNLITGCVQSYGTVKITVSGCKQCSDFDFYYGNNLCAKEKIIFVKYLNNCRAVPISQKVEYKWDYGDGTGITADSIHQYANPGSYLVTLYSSNNCIAIKSINIVDCSNGFFSCQPPVDEAAIACSNFKSRIPYSTITFNSNPASDQIEYKFTPNVGSIVNYTYNWNIKMPVPKGFSVIGQNNTDKFIIKKDASAEDNIILELQVCMQNQPGCCYLFTFQPCENFNPQIEELLTSKHYDELGDGNPGTKSCTVDLKLKPIQGALPGTNYTYLWTKDLAGAITPDNTVGPVTTIIPNKTVEYISVLVIEQNNNMCRKSDTIIIHPLD